MPSAKVARTVAQAVESLTDGFENAAAIAQVGFNHVRDNATRGEFAGGADVHRTSFQRPGSKHTVGSDFAS